MKKLILYLIVFSSLLFITSCSLFKTSDIYDDHTRCDKLMENLTSYLEKDDFDNAKALFAKRLYELETFDDDLNDLINYYDGTSSSINGMVTTGDYSNYNYQEKHHGLEYTIVTNIDTFRFRIRYIEKDTRDDNNVGIVSLYVLKLSEDEYPNDRYVGASISIDGIHVAYPHELPDYDE